MKKIFLAISAIAILAIACNKMTNVQAIGPDYKKVNSKVNELFNTEFKQKRDQLSLENSNNDYDFVGKLHNIGLESFVNNYTQINGLVNNNEMSFRTLINSNTLYLGQNSSINQFNTSVVNNNSLLTYLKNLGSSNSSFVTAFDVINFHPTNDFKDFYLEMLNAVDGINRNDESSFSRYLGLVKNIEDDIIVSTLQNDEKDILLATASVARFSAGYWFYNTSLNIWNSGNLNNPPYKAIIKWDIAGGAGGAAAGAIVGGTVTIPVGGIGSLPGWVAGAITGAVGGSVSEAVFEFLDWVFG